MAIVKEGNVKWVDGLRGLASALVVLTHLCRAFGPSVFQSTSNEKQAPSIPQLPFVRVLFQGRIGVSIFAMVTGYVCALKPIKLSGQTNHAGALAGIAKSALRRVPRLALPTSIATVFMWFMLETGLFDVAKRCESTSLGALLPERTDNVFSAVNHLFKAIIQTWAGGANNYDGAQWTLLPLLKCSMQAYAFLIATVYVRPRWRMVLSLFMFAYFWAGNDSAFGMQTFWGIFLADLQSNHTANDFLTRRRLTRVCISVTLLTLGLYIASYPEANWEWTAWSRGQHAFLESILPAGGDFIRFSTSIGLTLISLGLHFSPAARDALAHRCLLWLGRQSFAVYLLHGTLMRSALAWLVYGISVPDAHKNDQGEMFLPTIPFPGMTRVLIIMPIWLALTYSSAVAWTVYVDPWCARLTEKMVAWIKIEDDDEKKGATTLLPV